MKKLLQKLFTIIGVITLLSAFTISIGYTSVYADDEGNGSGGSSTSSSNDFSDCRTFLGMPSWDCHLSSSWQGKENLQKNIWQIAKNVADAITKLAAYLLVGYVIYGGYLYIFSSGDPTKTAAGKKTIARAFIGLAIVVFANIIISSAGIAMLGASGAFDSKNCIKNTCVTPEKLVKNIVDWVIGISGAVAAIYVVVGGIGYITSSGDTAKLQKSKNTIIYALIGLVIVAFSIAISNFAADAIDNANSGKDIRGPIINLLNFVIGFASVVSVIFIIKGGVGYMTSTGDPGKIKTAKDTILYACIGLIVCALSFAIVNWAIDTIENSEKEQSSEETSFLTKPNITLPSNIFK